MSKTKKVAKQATTRGHAYELTAKGKKLDPKELGPQKQIIFPVLKAGNKTAAQIAEAVGKKLETKQEPLAVVSFYLAQFKRDGIVTFAKATKAAPKARKAKSEPAATEEAAA